MSRRRLLIVLGAAVLIGACSSAPRRKAPAQPIEFVAADDRPQPRLDRMRGKGMAATVGRLRPCSLLDWKFTVLSHNTIRGGAGAAVLNGEFLAALGKLAPAAARDHVAVTA